MRNDENFNDGEQKKPIGNSEEFDDLLPPSFMRKNSKSTEENEKSSPKDYFVSNEPFDESDDHYKTRKPENGFELKIDEIKAMPDYVATRRVKKGLHRAGVFAKVMFGLIIVCISVGLAMFVIFAGQDVLGIGKQENMALVEIKENTGLSQVAETLEKQGVINSAFLFKTYCKALKEDVKFQYGTYSLKSNMSYDAILIELQKYSSSKEEVQIMFKEGSTIYQIANLLQQNGVCSANEFVTTLENTDFGFEFEKTAGQNELAFHKLEGFAFPDTYKFFKGDSPVNAAKKFLSNYNNKVSEKMLVGAPGVALSQTDILTVASIVQREAGKLEEMKKVASVYLNRIKNPGEFPKLQADPTREYANELKLQMSVLDQKVIDAYNTYEGQGLPPGPICNPGLDAIEAVLSADDTNYFYFCTDSKTGEFYYAETLEEHNKNVKKAGLRQN